MICNIVPAARRMQAMERDRISVYERTVTDPFFPYPGKGFII